MAAITASAPIWAQKDLVAVEDAWPERCHTELRPEIARTPAPSVALQTSNASAEPAEASDFRCLTLILPVP